jgi:hypothetical protein
MLCSLAVTAFLASPSDAQQPYGAGVRPRAAVQQAASRPVSTFGTAYPTTPTPGPVHTVYDRPAAQTPPQQQAPAQQAPVQTPRPGGASMPGAAGKVMYFHKAAGATAPDGLADHSTVAMAAHQDAPPPGVGVPDVPASLPGIPQPVAIPQTVIEKPVAAPAFDLPAVPPQPFIDMPPDVTRPVFAPVVQPESKPPEAKQPEGKQPTLPKAAEISPEATVLPPRSAIFTISDDPALERMIYESIAKQLGKTPEDLQKQSPFPTLKPTVPEGTQYVAKTVNLPPGRAVYEAGFVVHGRLHFEEKNSERQAWDLGLAQPFVSTVSFYKNTLLWPSSLASGLVIGRMDTNAGKCLPGSPTPYYLYPQGLTITGGVAEGIVITGLSFIIP